MSAPSADQSANIANLQSLISQVTGQLDPDRSTEAEQVAMGTYLTQLTQALDALVGVQKKTRLPFRVTNTHPRW